MKTINYPIVYPESDGKPMSDNTKQHHWIIYLKTNLDVVFGEEEDVFVAGDLLWYPVEGNPKIRVAPDVLVAIGRPKGHRGSYLQWLEEGIAPQVVFEIISPGNNALEMSQKLNFYGQYGVEEYYAYDPDSLEFAGWVRQGELLQLIDDKDLADWVSPRLGIRFVTAPDTELRVYHPDGRQFMTLTEAESGWSQALEQVHAERERADAERERAGAEHERANAEHQRAEAERQRAEAERQRAERFAERMRALGLDPDAL